MPKLLKEIIQIDIKKSKNLNYYIRKSFSLYPVQTFQDLYKTIFQGFFGSTHFEYASKKDLIKSEIKKTDKIQYKPIIELLPPAGDYSRLNLTPLKFLTDYSEDRLIDLIKKIVLSHKQSDFRKYNFLDYWKQQILPIIEEEDLQEFLQLTQFLMNKTPLPLFHHSLLFNNLYTPSYRVVYTKKAIALLMSHGIYISVF